MLRLIGAVLIVVACCGFGILSAVNLKKEESTLRQLLQGISFMECELQFRLSSLPELCVAASEDVHGLVSAVFFDFANELSSNRYMDPGCCMDKLLVRYPQLSNCIKSLLHQLGNCLGKFDLDGQLKGLRYVKEQCLQVLDKLSVDKDVRIRNYQTLGLCAGLALAILLI